jgi:AGZA family xanthine/uracil permease-like MFS transporter
MISTLKDFPFERFDEAFPSFLIMIVMPLTNSITNGIGFGFITFTSIKLMSGKGREVHWLMYLITFAFTVNFSIPALKSILGF